MSDYWSSKTVFAGFATKTDFNSIIDATVKMEKFRYNQLSKQQAETNFKKEQVEGLNRTLLTYKKQLGSMDSIDEFLVKTVNSSKSDIATATVKAGAQEGVHSLEVEQLAEVATAVSGDLKEVVYSASNVSDVDMAFSYDGQDYTVTVKPGMTAKELAAAITRATDNKLKGSVVDLGHGGNFKIQLRGMELGAGHDIVLSTELESVLQGKDDGSQLVAPYDSIAVASKNAKFILDDIPLQRDSNSVSDVTEGVTYNLNAAEDNTKVTLKVETDYDAIVANVEKFVQLTNELRTGFDLVKDYKNEELDKKGVNYSLKSSSQIKSVENKLKNVLASQGVGFIQGDGVDGDIYATLSTLGIKTIARNDDKDMGKLEFDKDAVIFKDGKQTFMDLLKADPESVASIFAAGGQGVSTDESVVEFNNSMYTFGMTAPGSYEIEYNGDVIPAAGDTTDVTMKINGVEQPVGYDPDTMLATIKEGDGKGLSFKVVDTSTGIHTAKIAIKEGKVNATVKALDEITAPLTGTFNAMVEKYKDQLTDPIYGFEKKMKDELARVDALEKRLIAQYAATEKTLSTYKNIQSMLDFQLKSQLADKD